MFYSPERSARSERCQCHNSFIFTTNENSVGGGRAGGRQSEIYTSRRMFSFFFVSSLFCLSHRRSQAASNLAGGVADVYFSITLIIDLDAVAAADNKGLKRDSLAESGEKKKRRRSRRGSA